MDNGDATFEGYRVERLLGRGGMGVVYEAVQTSLDRRVALKVLRSELAADLGYAERLRREGRLQASIEHPHVLDVYEVAGSDESLFLAMRLVEGPTLADLIRDGELIAQRALGLLEQVAGALDAAHGAGLVHRDVKPQNVLVGPGDHAFLADFGLSRGDADPATSTRPLLGTLAYVAPEVVRGEPPGPAADIYALAATLFHCLTGDVPFPRGSDAAVLHAHASDDPPQASERRPELPAGLDAVLAAGLAKDPARRPSSALGLVADVRRALGSDVRALAPPRPGPGGPARTATAARSMPAASSPTRRARAAAFAGAVLGAAALGAGGMALLAADADEPASEVPVPALPDGAEALGSGLGAPTASLGCRGGGPAAGPCAIVQTDLADAQLLVPAEGNIVGWSVRGAEGELALDVIRPRGEETVRVARSQWESAGNAAPHRFATKLHVEQGDVLGVELGSGATVGVTESEGATTNRWFGPEGGQYGVPDRGAGTGFDHELLLRADFVPGGEPLRPRHLSGAAAARAPDGRVRERATVEISKPSSTLQVELVEVGGRVALDRVRGDRRLERVFVPDLVPGGQPIDLKTYTYEGQPNTEIDIWWVNPNSGRMIFHFFNATRGRIQFLG